MSPVTIRLDAQFGTPYPRSAGFDTDKGKELLVDIHGGDCGNHSSSRTLVGKAFRSGFYWPTALNDAVELVKACEACQFHAKQIH